MDTKKDKIENNYNNKLTFNKKKIEIEIRKIFNNAVIKNYEFFIEGLVSPTFKIKINNPSKTLVVKLTKIKREKQIIKNNLILEYLNKNKILAPRIYLSNKFEKKIITIMSFCKGKNAKEVYLKSNEDIKKEILYNAGHLLKKIHNLKIPQFWEHQKHEIKDVNEWKNWTKNRISKYLLFIKNKMKNEYKSIEKILNNFYNILENEKFNLSPLHWDYHFANFNVNEKGKITGIFDFDNSMKGHNLADIGQTLYWINFHFDEKERFFYFLNGYKKKFNNKELELIKGYYLLHILAVTRSIWFKKRLRWIIDKHIIMINDMIKNDIF
ncbi:MAG: aminoglycoside phosphotransferase family protein [Candidatus Nanoarchaeia archaeon]|nr:aminoglycoside phosphotransferase family protein [Candidatus Nanoarchaeia archaeon]